VDTRDRRDINNEAAFAAVTEWALNGHVTPTTPLVAWLDRLALALLTESFGGYVIANDGAAYAPGKHPSTLDGLPPAEAETVRARVYGVLRMSLNMPHDVVIVKGVERFSDGRSTGPLQQISYEASRALKPNLTGGWAPMEATMRPADAALAFIRRLTITNNPVYTSGADSVVLSSPIAADVLRTQSPSIASARSSNYSAENIALAQRMARGGNRFWTDKGAS
jgi:hypothetical protein